MPSPSGSRASQRALAGCVGAVMGQRQPARAVLIHPGIAEIGEGPGRRRGDRIAVGVVIIGLRDLEQWARRVDVARRAGRPGP